MSNTSQKEAFAHRPTHILTAILFAAMTLISFVNVVGRNLFHDSLAYTEEVTKYLFVYVTILGAGIAFERGTHLGMVTILRRMPRGWRIFTAWASAFLAGLIMLAVGGLLLHTVYQEIRIFQATSPALNIPMWLYYLGAILMLPPVFLGIYRGARTATCDAGSATAKGGA